MTATEAAANRGLVYRVAGAADVDPRTVISALAGRVGKGSAYRRTMAELKAAGVDVATIVKASTKGPSPLTVVPGGR